MLLSGQEKKGIPVIAIVGDVGAGAEKMYDHGIDAIFSINRVAVPFSEAKKNAPNRIWQLSARIWPACSGWYCVTNNLKDLPALNIINQLWTIDKGGLLMRVRYRKELDVISPYVRVNRLKMCGGSWGGWSKWSNWRQTKTLTVFAPSAGSNS